MTGCAVEDVFELVDQLPEVTRADNGRYWRLAVAVFEAWRLTAPSAVVERRADRLPR